MRPPETDMLSCKAKDIVNKIKQHPTEWENILPTPYMTKDWYKLDTKIPNNPIKNWDTDLNIEFSTEESQMTKRQLRNCSKSPVTR